MAKVWLVVVVALVLVGQLEALTLSKRKAQLIAKGRANVRFDWNHQTALSGIKPMLGMDMPSPREVWKGWISNTYPGGHNFATRRAVDYVIAKARASTGVANQVTKIMRATLDALTNDHSDTVRAVNQLVFGNFENELRVNIDGDHGAAAAGAVAIRTFFKNDREVTPDGTHSRWWTAETGYSSANPIHAMLVTSSTPARNTAVFTQVYSYDQMVAFAREMITEAITLLRAEKDGTGVTPNWEKGIRAIGGVLHAIQDSACACTPKHWALQQPAGVNGCIAGDGHSVLAFLDGRWKVTGMSDQIFYDQRNAFHAKLDSLYEPGHVLPVATLAAAADRAAINRAYDADPAMLWGDNDPAYDGGNLILAVFDAALGTADPAATANTLVATHLEGRYVPKANLRMPTIDESTRAKAAHH